MLVTAVRRGMVMVGGRRASRGAGVVVGVQVVQGQVLPTVAPTTQVKVVMVVAGGSRARVMFVGNDSGSASLAHHYSP